jgi:AICAR transformylase/IMP cyclohydrolase PurH
VFHDSSGNVIASSQDIHYDTGMAVLTPFFEPFIIPSRIYPSIMFLQEKQKMTIKKMGTHEKNKNKKKKDKSHHKNVTVISREQDWIARLLRKNGIHTIHKPSNRVMTCLKPIKNT